MKPIANSLDRLQGEKNVSIGSVLPCLYYIQAQISCTDITSRYCGNLRLSTIAQEMQQTMEKIFENRFSAIMKFNAANKEFILAAFSHPVYKLNWITNEPNIGIAKTFLEEEAACVSSNIETCANDEIVDVDEDEFLPQTDLNLIRRSSTETSSSIGVEILNFYHDRDKNITMLNRYPTIGRIYRRYNTTLSSSSPVERLFSQALLIFTPRRNRILDENFEKAVMLQKNKEL